ncbi:TetR/AcrR family transcriptional regulator [Cryobacterium sp. CG_9.6]|uniref:TetR/AcrR family transcriptional regulator n=1 Tax=Cryobacterium sp. CG_9.6 TaxID=2760710 RepID=UPI002473327A|nr:TetR/AcrR family transcriptional regulator [Cryobacterium sp. CG_9.6]MDH6235478.1 AcrR family transcriptional regulator [Cryobacterium sp. CG_9.6]
MSDASAAVPVPLTRVDVADIAVRLFHEFGYEATSATQIAEAAGVSRSTFFRQFGSKDDVIFADHDELLEQISSYFASQHEDPWTAVCEAASLVFERFRERLEIVRLRDLVVRESQVLRDRETVMVSRYEKTFATYLRQMLPRLDPLVAIRFASAVTATHNFELRRLIRSDARVGPEELAAELVEVRRLLSPTFDSSTTSGVSPDLVVAVFPASTSPYDLARAIEERLRAITG